ncbi:MAG: glycyl-radical enzyme activating protein [Actinomycetota bacterium]|nr:glycyl-radical enzyme activating protein [Actinomycetota bacterium]
MKSSPENLTDSEFEGALKGLIFNIQRFSIEDGPGIRSTVFMKGCSLRCPWCQNPEGLKKKQEIMWFETRCIAALECVRVCAQDALRLEPSGMLIDRGRCDGCGKCAEACPTGAIELVGRYYLPEEVLSEVVRDSAFYENSGGGITVSGGEPLVQHHFVKEFLRLCKENRLHTALDTSGGYEVEALEEVLPFVDIVLLDVKVSDPEKHLEWTGIPLELVTKNLKTISEFGKPVWIRTPIIPGYTDAEENIEGILRFVSSLDNVQRYDLLAFNNTCASKYKRLSMEWKLEGKPLLEHSKMESLARKAISCGAKNVHWSGMTKS